MNLQGVSIDEREPDRLSTLDMPSLTTVAFIAIVFMAFQGIAPLNSDFYTSGDYSPTTSRLVALGSAIALFSVCLRLFLTAPERWIKANSMRPLDEIEPELVKSVTTAAHAVGLLSCPKVLVTEAPRVSIQAFGTFRRYYIVVNQQELNAAKALGAEGALETMLVHELAHFRHGDVWKLRLAQRVVGVFMVFALIVLSYGAASPALLQLGLNSAPRDFGVQASALLTYPLLILLQLLLLKSLRDIREFHADARVVQFRGSNAVVQALFMASRFWARGGGGAEKKQGKPGLRGLRPVLGLTFLGPTGSATARLDALRDGAVFHRSVHWAIVASGFAVGTSWLSVGSMLNQINILFIGGLLLVSTIYLLPRIGERGQGSFRHILRAVGYFLLGYYSCWLLALAVVTTTYIASDTYRPLLAGSLAFYLILGASVLLDTLYAALGLALTVPVLRWIIQAKKSGSLPYRWAVGEVALPVAVASGIVALCNVLLDPNIYGLKSKIVAVALLALLIVVGASYLGLIRGRRHAAGR